MATFTDDFSRANGAMGNGWGALYDSPQISSGTLVSGSGSAIAYQSGVSDAGRVSAAGWFYWLSTNTFGIGPMVKLDGTNPVGYCARVYVSSGTVYLQISTVSSGTHTNLAQASLGSSIPPYVYIYLEWDHGHLLARCQGVTVEVDDATFSANPYTGVWLRQNYGACDSFTAVGGSQPVFTVTPNPCGNYGVPVSMTATGTNTAWTAGTPGSPTFTVDHGTISDQVVSDVGAATFTYDPGSFLGTAIFTDPSSGAVCYVTVSSNPSIVNPGGAYGFTPQAITMVNNTAGESYLETLTKPNTPMTVDAYATLTLDTLLGSVALNTGATLDPNSVPSAGLVWTLWRLINGGYDSQTGPFPAPSFATVDAGLATLRDRWLTGNNGSMYTVADLLGLLGGTPLANHQDILAAISAIPTGDNQDVLDAIAALAGDPLATVKAAIDLVYQLGTTEGYTLADVKTWAEAVQGSGLPTVKGVLDKLGSSGSTVDAQFTALSQLIVSETTIQGIIDLAVAALAGAEGATIDAVLTAISDLAGQIAPTSALTRPVWPGLDLATVGDAVSLTDGLEVEGPLDGLLVHISATPSRAGRFGFGTVSSWRYVGAVIFQSDRGDWEWAQPIGLDDQVVTPASMTHAVAAKFRLEGGFAGTVRPFTVGV